MLEAAFLLSALGASLLASGHTRGPLRRGSSTRRLSPPQETSSCRDEAGRPGKAPSGQSTAEENLLPFPIVEFDQSDNDAADYPRTRALRRRERDPQKSQSLRDRAELVSQ